MLQYSQTTYFQAQNDDLQTLQHILGKSLHEDIKE